MIRNNLSWINLNAGSSGGSGGGGVSDYNDLANRPIISMTGTSQNPLKLWNLSTGLYLLNGYVYYNTTNTRECVNLFVSITAQIQNGKYVLSAFVPSWEGHYEYIKANSTSTDYTDTQILKMLTEDDVLTLTNEVEYTPTTDYHPSTKKYVDEAMQSVMEEFAKMGVNEQDIKTLIAENRRRDIAIQALLNETEDKNVTIEEDTHTISLDYSMEDGMATVNSIEGSTLVNVSKTVDEVYVTKSQDRVEQTKVANTIGEQNGKICPIIEGDTLVNVCDQKDPIAITKSYAVENSGNHIALQGEYDGSCRPVIHGNTMVNLFKKTLSFSTALSCNDILTMNSDTNAHRDGYSEKYRIKRFECYYPLKTSTTYTLCYSIIENNNNYIKTILEFDDGTTIENRDIIPYLDLSSNRIIFTTPSDKNAIKVWMFIDSGVEEVKESKITNVMLFEGDLTQTPELIPTEYVEGLKSSFEDNVVTQAMVDSGEESAENLGKYKVEYKVTGKNKCDNSTLRIGTIQGGSFENFPKGVYCTQYIPIDINKKYIFSTKGFVVTETHYAVQYDKNKEFISTLYGTGANYTFSDNCRYIRLGARKTNTDDIITEEEFNNTTFQLEEGSTPTEYEPYKEYTKTFYLNSPLLEGDTIEDVNGVATHVKRYRKVVVDGSEDEDWRINKELTAYNTTQFTWGAALDSFRDIYGKTSVLSDKIPSVTGDVNSDNIWIYNGDILVIHKNLTTVNELKQWLQQNPTTVVYQLKTPIYEPISTESILCDSYANGHLDFDSAVPVEKVKFVGTEGILTLRYLQPNTQYLIQFTSDNVGKCTFTMNNQDTIPLNVSKGINKAVFTTNANTMINSVLWFSGIGFNASNIVVTEATDKDFDYFNGIQSTFEENLVTDENNPHYGKYRVIYRTKSSDGNASTVKSVYLNSPLLQGDKLVVVNGKLCHYHRMGMVVLDGSEVWEDTTSTYVEGYRLCHRLMSAKEKGFLITDKFRVVEHALNGNTHANIFFENIMSLHTHSNLLYVYTKLALNGFKQWLQANPTTVVYELASPYYEEISSNPKDAVVDFYVNGTLEVQSAVYPLSMEFTSFEEELTYLYASTVYTVQFEANGNAIANITLGGTTVTNQEITHGLNRIQVTTPSTLVDNKLIIDGCGDCKISKVVVTNSTEEFEYFEGMKSAFEDKQNEDGTYTVEIVVYNAPIRLNKDKE